SFGIPGHPHLLLAAGKEGKIYVVDRDNMGKFSATNDNVLNAIPNGIGNNTPPVQLGGAVSTPAIFDNKIYWVSGYFDSAVSFTLSNSGPTAGRLTVTSQTTARFGYLPGSIVVSANGTLNGIAWVMDSNENRICAYDAATFATPLWDSSQAVGGVDNVGAVVKFAVPTVANGQVFVGTSNSLAIYGVRQQATAAPNAPVLSAT